MRPDWACMRRSSRAASGSRGDERKYPWNEVAAKCAEVIELGRFFNALRNDLAIQLASESKNEIDNIVGGSIRLHVGDEKTINLENIGTELAESRERGVAGAEIINRGGDFETLQLREDIYGVLRVDHGDAFGDRELNCPGADAGIAQLFLDAVE